jgi:hypothetical protein
MVLIKKTTKILITKTKENRLKVENALYLQSLQIKAL